MTPSVHLRDSRSASPIVWIIRASEKTYRVRTFSMRTALQHVEKLGGRSPVLIDIATNVPGDLPIAKKPRPSRRQPSTRRDRVRSALLPEALSRRATGQSTVAIAKALGVPRETLRDWFLAHAA